MKVLLIVAGVPATVAGKVWTPLRSKIPRTSGKGWGCPTAGGGPSGRGGGAGRGWDHAGRAVRAIVARRNGCSQRAGRERRRFRGGLYGRVRRARERDGAAYG